MTDDDKKEALAYAIEQAQDMADLEKLESGSYPLALASVTSDGKSKLLAWETLTAYVTTVTTNIYGTMADRVAALNQATTNMQNAITSIQTKQTEHSEAISTLQSNSAKMVALTQDEYDALVEAGTVDTDTYYNIFE